MITNLSKAMGRHGWGVVWGLGLAALLLSGCSSTPDSRFAAVPGVASDGSAPASAMADSTPSAPNPYNTDIIEPGESLVINITDLPTSQLPIQDQVKQDGTITLLLNHTFHAAGKTRRQLEQEVHDYYVPAFYRQMTVSIQGQPQTRFYFVDGEVKLPGRQVYIGPMTVLKSIASAGGLTDYAARTKVKLIHPDGRVQTVNCRKAIDHPALDLPVYPDDKIYVPRRLFW